MLHSEPMRAADAAWFHMDRPQNTADIVSLLGLDGHVRFERIRELIDERLLGYARFRERVREGPFGAARWEPDPHFDLERHLIRTRVHGPVERALPPLISEVASEPLDASRPPWRMLVVEGAEGGTALVSKLHHCLGDGYALVAVLRSLADGPVPDIQPAPIAYRDLSVAHAGVATLLRALRDPAEAARLAKDALAFARSLARMTLLPFDPRTMLSRPHTGVRRVAWTRGVPLAATREAAHRAGATLNELVLAALAGALRTVLAAAGERVDDLELRVLVPVNTRRSAASGSSLDNAFGLVFVDLPIRIPNAADRLAVIRERIATLRRSPDALVALAVLGAMGALPPQIERLGSSFFAHKATAVVTNVPGPTEKLELAGHRLDRLLFWVPHPATLKLGVSVMSYAGEVRVGVRADISALRDPAALTLAFEQELRAFGVEVPEPLGPERSRRRVRASGAAEAAAPA